MAYCDDNRMFTHMRTKKVMFSQVSPNRSYDRSDMLPPVIKVGNLKSLRTWSDVRDAVRAYHLLLPIIQ